MAANSDAIFFACCGCIIAWLGLWAFIGRIYKEFNPNAPPGSKAKKTLDAINVIQTLPLLPLVPIFVIWILGIKRPIERFFARRRQRKEVVRLRRQWRDERRELARGDIEEARSEKSGLFVSSEKVEDVDEPQIRESRPQSGESRLERLPAELRMEIYSYLDYGMALTLGRANRFIQRDEPWESIDREQRAIFVYHADTFKHNQKADRLACFSCLRVRAKGNFDEANRTGAFTRYGLRDIERMCLDCRSATKKMKFGESMVWRLGKWEKRTYNRIVRFFGTPTAEGL